MAENREKIKARQKEYYRKNKAKISAYNKRWNARNRDKVNARARARYRKNHQKELERGRIWRERKRKHRTAYNKAWIRKNPERYKQWQQKYLNEHKAEDKLKKRLAYWRQQQVQLVVLAIN